LIVNHTCAVERIHYNGDSQVWFLIHRFDSLVQL